MLWSVYKKKQVQMSKVNTHLLYLMIGDSQITGATTTQPVGWSAAYGDVNEKTKILYRDNRTTGDYSTLRWLTYVQDGVNGNRYPGYGAAGWLTTALAGIDAPFMSYMRTNSVKPVGLLKWALGGTTLQSRAGADNDWSVNNNEMYRYLVVDYAKAHNRDGIHNSRIRAVLISLGTNDCFVSVWNNITFRANIGTFIASLRAVFSNPTLPIYWIQVRSDLSAFDPVNYPAANVTQCRQALIDFSFGGANEIPNVFLYDWEAFGGTSDGVHFDADMAEHGGLEFAEDCLTLYSGN